MILSAIFVILLSVHECFLENIGSGRNGNLRLCVVESRGRYKKAGKYCPVLEKEHSGIECVLGYDSMDCLRRMNKGTVDFGVFMPEELVATQWAQLDVLVTNQIPNRPGVFAEQIVAVISKKLAPEGASKARSGGAAAVMKGANLCHPWSDGNDDLSPVIQQYLESLATEHSCLENLTLSENRIRDSSMFFKTACKAGKWHPDDDTDVAWKQKYPNLCSACYNRKCDVRDRYWGPRGATYCLDDQAGDVLWARYTDIQSYFFQREKGNSGANSSEWFILCQDGSVQTIKDGEMAPCVWLAKPWPVVVAKRKTASEVIYICSQLKAESLVATDWKGALIALLDARGTGSAEETLTPPFEPPTKPEDYLANAKGFREAYSQTGCQPPRQIRLCVTSSVEMSRCQWGSEAASVFGVEPAFYCVTPPDGASKNVEGCLRMVMHGMADAAIAAPDYLVKAVRDYNLEPTIYEAVLHLQNTNKIFAYVRNDSSMTWASIKGSKAYFPGFDTLAWHAAVKEISIKCNMRTALADYFGPSCVLNLDEKSGLPPYVISKMTELCRPSDNGTDGEESALKALVEGRVDVAFLSSATLRRFADGASGEQWAVNLKSTNVKPVCKDSDKSDGCHLAWSSLGHVYTSKNITDVRRKEIEDLFKKLDQVFGKINTYRPPVFSLFGPFYHQNNVLFHDDTDVFNTVEEMEIYGFNRLSRSFEGGLKNYLYYQSICSNVNKFMPNYLLISVISLFLLLLRFY